jgi:hypothetical protein
VTWLSWRPVVATGRTGPNGWARVPELDIFSQGVVDREGGGWKITDKRTVLEFMEAPTGIDQVIPAATAIRRYRR